MSTETADEKARKRAAMLHKRRVALAKAMEKDLHRLRKIIHGQAVPPGLRK